MTDERMTATLPMTPAQRGLWIAELASGASVSHNVPIRLALSGSYRPEHLQQAVDALVARHENLRMRVRIVDGEPRLEVQARIDVTVRRLPGDETLEARVRAELEQPLPLVGDTLLRAACFELGGEERLLLLVVHHLVFDGNSVTALVEDLSALFDGIVAGVPATLPALPACAEVAARQLAAADAAAEAALAYWRTELSGAPSPLQFPSSRRADAAPSRRSAHIVKPIESAVVARLRALGPGAATPFMLHAAVCAVLMLRYTGAQDIVFGMPLSTRDASDAGSTGLFVNVMPLRLRPLPTWSFDALLKHVRGRVLRTLANGRLPFHELVQGLRLARDGSSNPLFRVCLNHATVCRAPVDAGNVRMRVLPTSNVAAAFEANFGLVEHEGGVDLVLEYDEACFERADVAALGGHYRTVLAAGLEDGTTALRDLELLTRDEFRAAVASPAVPDTRACMQPVHREIEAQAVRTPDAVAIAFEGVTWTYAELDARATRWAACLRGHRVARGVIAAVCIDRGPEMVVGILSVLKAGAAYVPIDPDNPDERIAWVLEDTSARVLLTSRRLATRFAGLGVPVLYLDEPELHPILDAASAGDDARDGGDAGMDDLAYCIYTSGSTGKPKGALNTHLGLANLVHWYTKGGLTMTAQDRVILASSIGFDLTQKNILGPLTVGATLAIPPCSPADAMGFLKALSAHRPTWLNCAPSAFRAFAASPRTHCLRMLVLGGEPVDAALEAELAGRPLTLVNSYGPTECADVALWCARSLADGLADSDMPLGLPLSGVRVLVLDDRLRPVPNGAPGEIHIAGVSVGQGYLGRPALTAEKFIPDPYGVPGSRMYKTGDLGRRRADGMLEFIGRIDFQVKIRGHRIELGEIEARLLDHSGVRQAVLVAHETQPGDKHLVAYVAADREDAGMLVESLRRTLPDYMVPSAWVFLPQLPLNLNGKVDRKALPAPDWTHAAAQSSYVGPRTPTERRLAAIWQQLLKVERVGVLDSFFSSWGNSLLAMQLLTRMAQEFGIELPSRAVFDAEHLAALAQTVDIALAAAAAPPAPPAIPRRARTPVA